MFEFGSDRDLLVVAGLLFVPVLNFLFVLILMLSNQLLLVSKSGILQPQLPLDFLLSLLFLVLLQVIEVSQVRLILLLKCLIVLLLFFMLLGVQESQKVPHVDLCFVKALDVESSVHIVDGVVLTANTFDLVLRVFNFCSDSFASNLNLSLSGTISYDKVLLRAFSTSTVGVEAADLRLNTHAVIQLVFQDLA